MRPWCRVLAALVLGLALSWGPLGSSLLAAHLAHDAGTSGDCCAGTHPDGMCPRHNGRPRVSVDAASTPFHFRCECSLLLKFVTVAAPPLAPPALARPDDLTVTRSVLPADLRERPFVPTTPPPRS
jgi:hypothetical protein